MRKVYINPTDWIDCKSYYNVNDCNQCKHPHWIIVKTDRDIIRPSGYEFECSICHSRWGYGMTKHCPECGAELDNCVERKIENDD